MGIAILEKPTPTLNLLNQYGITSHGLSIALIISGLALFIGAWLKKPIYALFYAPFVLYMGVALTLLSTAPFYIYTSSLVMILADYTGEVLEWRHNRQLR